MEKVKPLRIPFFHKNQIPLAFINKIVPTHGIVLAADIGGTKTNLALFKISDKSLEQIQEQSFPTKDYASFTDMFRDFHSAQSAKIDAICLGVAGPVIEGVVQGTNFPWGIDSKDIRKKLKVTSVFVINDLEANAYGLSTLEEEDFETIIPVKSSVGNAAIISPGTGLGEAGLFWEVGS